MKLELIKEFIGDNKKEGKVFFTGLKEKTLEQKFQYIKNHYVYNVMNSWNRLQSIANNIKIYNLELTNEQIDKFFELISIDEELLYANLQFSIEDFEDITNTNIFFNGRSNGYLVIVPKFDQYNKRMNILDLFFDDNIYDYDTLKEFKKESLDTAYGKDNEDINNNLEECYYLLKSFDLLCDLLREELIYMLNNAKIKEKTEVIEKNVKYIEVE
jgi:hypothetical protein